MEMGFEEKCLGYEFHYERAARPKKVSQAILAQIEESGCGTLVIGRKGSTHAREFRVGSVALRTVAEARDCAVWVV